MDGAKALLHATNPFLLDRRGAAPAAPAGELIFPPFNATAAPSSSSSPSLTNVRQIDHSRG